MAIIAMKKLRLIGLKTEEKVLLNALFSSQLAEPVAAKAVEGTEKESSAAERQAAESKLARLQNAVKLVEDSQHTLAAITKKSETPYALPKKGLFSIRKEVSYDDFTCIPMREVEIFANVAEIESLYQKRRAIESEITRKESYCEQLAPFLRVEQPFSFYTDTQNATVALGTAPMSSLKAIAALPQTLSAESESSLPIAISYLPTANDLPVVAVVYLKDLAEAITPKLNEFGFVRCTFTDEKTALQLSEQTKDEISALQKERRVLIEDLCAKSIALDEMRLLYDYYSVELDKSVAGQDFARTERSFYMEAWVPEPGVQKVTDLIYGVTNRIVFDFVDPEEGDLPPTLTQNGALVSAFEGITNSYSVPLPTERDPNGPMSFFFFLFFGIMLSDAGYGLLMALTCFFLWKFVKMEKGLKRMMMLFCLCGISTILWGAFFGGWFGIQLNDHVGNPLADFLIVIRQIDPLTQPVPMMILCLALGLVQIMTGLLLKAIDLCKSGKVWSAIFDIGSWYLVFIGLVLLACSMLGASLAGLQKIGIYLALAGVVMLLLTQGRAKPTLFGKIFGGVKSLYGIVNYFSDILSYTRLFALGLATGVIGWVMNILAGMFFGSVATFLFGIIILLIGHAFNMGINTLGAYVHDCRLQYVEFFSKFYEGGGHEFRPLGSKIRYNRILMEQKNK